MLGLAGRCSAAAAAAVRPLLRRGAGPGRDLLPLLLSRGAGPAAAAGARECGAARGHLGACAAGGGRGAGSGREGSGGGDPGGTDEATLRLWAGWG